MTISQLKNILSRKLVGATIDDIQGITDYTLFKEAASNLVNEIDPAETVRKTTVSVFGTVYDYAPPADLKGVVDIRPQSNRGATDNPTRRFSEDFDIDKGESDFTLEWRDASRLLRYKKNIGNTTELHTMDSLTANGTWDGTATNRAISTFNPYKGSGAIQADFATGQYIENDDMTKIDLSDHENKSTLFLPIYLPDSSVLTSIGLRFGSSTSAYFTQTATAPQFGSFANGWNLVPFNWDGATETGTVDTDNMDYLRITLTLSASDTDIKLDNVFSALPKVQDLLYYSKYLFKATGATGAWKETPTADTDIINLDTDAENLFVYECVRLIALQTQGRDGIYKTYTDMLYGNSQEVGKYERYKTRNPAEAIKPQVQHRKFSYNKK